MMSVTPDHHKKVGMGVTPSPNPFFTPRPERRRTDLRESDSSSNHHQNRDNKEKEVNVQVLLRCRPLNDDERRANIPRAISCNEQRREVTVVQSVANKQVDKVFTFDKVFGPKAQQRSIYDQAVAPIVNEVLEGFNCTVFAYGQTGTGKTYTMEGGMRNKGGDLPAEAGVIPRAVRHIFDSLEAQNADYSVKVTFLELYNEEITDLLAPEDHPRSLEEKQKKPISLMEDGKGVVVVRGLEEEAVYSVNEIYTLLERGAAKRRTADTLLNKRSSRSHSIFSITVHIKEAAVIDEDLIKCGKLNLVDLAGSENISRSGAREGRAREAGEINKSLLTLGRVINALVEHSNHVPYRDSKLTRLLRDSLGGKTKTCIIATISPSAHCLEETLSTLDYAYRAKNIKNKPEANQKMSKAVLLKDLYLEIERMKEDVKAAREKNGVYIPRERYIQDEAEKKARIEKIEQLENDLNHSEKKAETFCELYLTEQERKLEVENELKECKINLESCQRSFSDLQEEHRVAISVLKEKEFIISKLQKSENSLLHRAKELCMDLQSASEDISSLFAKLESKDSLEAKNQSTVLTFGSQLDQNLKDLHKIILASVSQQQQRLRCMEEQITSYIATKSDATQILESRIEKMVGTYNLGALALKDLVTALQQKSSSEIGQINARVSSQAIVVENFLANAALEAKEIVGEIRDSLNEQKQLLDFSIRQQEEGLQRNMVSAQNILKASENFFNDLQQHASNVMTILEEIKIERSQQFLYFEKMFKEKSAREEKEALEKIAEIVASLSSKKTSMVSEASRNIQGSTVNDNKRLQQEMFHIQQVFDTAKKGFDEYKEKVETHFMEDAFSATHSRAMMENLVDDCLKRLDHSRQHWDHTQSSLKNLNEKSTEDIESTVKSCIYSNHFVHEEYVSVSNSLETDFDAGVSDLRAAVSDSLISDHENKREMDSMTSLCLNELKSIQDKHGRSISTIRTQAEKWLVNDYLVDQHTDLTPKKRVIEVPSLKSLEEMRTIAYEKMGEENGEENRSKWAVKDGKFTTTTATHHHHHHLSESSSPIRTPFANVN